MTEIVHSSTPVTLIGGAPLETGDLTEALTIAPTCVAADGGAQAALAHNIIPTAVIGDFDSVDRNTLDQIPADRLHKISEQNSTDFDKALRHIASPVVIAVGFAGGRLDHQLATFHGLLRHAQRACIIVYPTEIVFHCPPTITLPLQAGETVSLFPLAHVTGQSTGLQWPIDALEFTPGRFIGTSNRSTGAVTLKMDGAGMLCILPRRYLGDVTRALAQAAPDARRYVRAK